MASRGVEILRGGCNEERESPRIKLKGRPKSCLILKQETVSSTGGAEAISDRSCPEESAIGDRNARLSHNCCRAHC
ncbi:Hypothetical protein NTJ_02954 [Nesidiocoris tenuis]|uniref:Uncharacterized protein n=1 Tax=Nesidiocoris tenuis TaxID=355587 RepID=A0ABN7ACX2_9HEMI|nr:Hypothetical protein NTJ_02954 [Nesidiocoris tenuis]